MRILEQRGYVVTETDDPGWCVPENGDWDSPDHEWIWDENRVTQLLDAHQAKHLFIDGCRSNQGKFYSRFDYIVVLTAPIDVMLHRVSTRSNNPFGKSLEQREQIAHDKQEFEPMLLRGADIVIDTSFSSPDDTADRLITLL